MKTIKPKLELPEGGILEIKRPRGSELYLPVRVRFADGTTVPHWWYELENQGVEVLDWTHPEITDKPLA